MYMVVVVGANEHIMEVEIAKRIRGALTCSRSIAIEISIVVDQDFIQQGSLMNLWHVGLHNSFSRHIITAVSLHLVMIIIVKVPTTQHLLRHGENQSDSLRQNIHWSFGLIATTTATTTTIRTTISAIIIDRINLQSNSRRMQPWHTVYSRH